MNGPKLIGRYEIVAEIGRGAMGSVFKARDPAVGRIVALKTVHAAALAGDSATEYRTRFYREARASGVLAHPGIVPVFDVGEHEGAPFLVMEFVDGRTLADPIKKGERFSLDRVCEIGQQIADALGYAHRQGVIHRDIKPANILMTSREIYGSERPRITDFGIAKLASSEITTSGQLLGTPSFMPPEQFTGQPVDGRADLFSLGVILYCLATGEQPFAGETMTAVSYKVVYTEPIPPTKLNPAISQGLERVILKTLAKSPADRFQTCEELAEVLASIRAGAPAATSESVAATLDANATLGPSPVASPPAPLRTNAPVPPAAQKDPAIGPGSVQGAGKSAKPQVETVFALILLAIAGVGIVGAGFWFVFGHFVSMAHRQNQQSSISTPQQTPQPIVQVPQPQANTTAETSQPQPVQSVESPPEPPAAGTRAPNAAAAKTGSAQARGSVAPARTASAAAASRSAAARSKPSPAQAPPPATSAAKAAVVSSNPGSSPTAPPAAPASSASSSNPAPAATTAFDPRKLDPNSSSKLKIELSKMPSGLPVSISMNRKPYLSFITGDKTDLDNLYVPAGVQEFHVTIKSGGQNFESKGVSQDFKAKKKKTLKIELTENGTPPASVAVPLPKDMQVYVSFPFSLSDVL